MQGNPKQAQVMLAILYARPHNLQHELCLQNAKALGPLKQLLTQNGNSKDACCRHTTGMITSSCHVHACMWTYMRKDTPVTHMKHARTVTYCDMPAASKLSCTHCQATSDPWSKPPRFMPTFRNVADKLLAGLLLTTWPCCRLMSRV